MPLLAGSRLGPYEIIAPIGAGGMGEVWKARDTRLDRTVAIKVCAEQFSERFEREARAVAALNHPHICILHDVGPNYLVMEYIEGRPLQGPLPVAQALKYGAQICDALDAAHKRGIVHRDLKPANILVTKSSIKLLDFGLAKVAKASASDDLTATITLTQANTILGTLQYMAPEQLEGKEADARADIFAFGAVLYEMLTGRHAFEAKSQASLIAAILEREPPSVAGCAPAALDRLVRRCLDKDPERRWESARDLRIELEWIAEEKGSTLTSAAFTRSHWQERAVWITALVLLLSAAGWFWPRPEARETVRFAIYPPEKAAFSTPPTITVGTPQFDLSPDGRSIVFVASMPGASPMLWLRSLAEVSAHPIPGTEDAEYPVWSHDGQWIGFFSENKLKKVPAAGGAVQVILQGLANPRGISWGPDDTILYSLGDENLFKVSSSGGTPVPVTKLDLEGGEAAHRWPQFLPGGKHFIFSVYGSKERRGLYAGSLDGSVKKFITPYDLSSSALYADPGYLLFLKNDTFMAQGFQPGTLELQGQPFPVVDKLRRSSGGKIGVSASRNRILGYADAMFRLGRLVWFNRAGKELDSLPGSEQDFTDFRISPDETRLALSLVDPKTGVPDIRMADLVRGGMTRFTIEPALNATPLWSPDGNRVVFRSNRRGVMELWQKSAGGGGQEEGFLPAAALRSSGVSVTTTTPTDWSPDGKQILFSMTGLGSGSDLWLAPLTADKKPVKFLGSPYDEMHGNFSPDGKLVAYSSNETGRFEVHIQTFPRSDRQWQVSTAGGSEPRWRRDEKEIYYLSLDKKLMAVSVGPGPSFGVPKPLFQTRAPDGIFAFRTHYAPSADGKRFLVNTQIDQPPLPIMVVLNWTAGLKR